MSICYNLANVDEPGRGCFADSNSNIGSAKWDPDISPGHFPLPDNSPPFLRGVERAFPPFHHHHPPIYNIKLYTVNVYKIDGDRSVRVRSTG